MGEIVAFRQIIILFSGGNRILQNCECKCCNAKIGLCFSSCFFLMAVFSRSSERFPAPTRSSCTSPSARWSRGPHWHASGSWAPPDRPLHWHPGPTRRSFGCWLLLGGGGSPSLIRNTTRPLHHPQPAPFKPAFNPPSVGKSHVPHGQPPPSHQDFLVDFFSQVILARVMDPSFSKKLDGGVYSLKMDLSMICSILPNFLFLVSPSNFAFPPPIFLCSYRQYRQMSSNFFRTKFPSVGSRQPSPQSAGFTHVVETPFFLWMRCSWLFFF